MADYHGEKFPEAPLFLRRFTDCGITFVVGGNLNVFGHALFRFGTDVGYIHVDEIHEYPKLIPSSKFQHYLFDNGKHTLHTEEVVIPNPERSLLKIEELRKEKWWWFGIPHNCVAFCEEIIQAGGGKWESVSNLPLIIKETYKGGARPHVRMRRVS